MHHRHFRHFALHGAALCLLTAPFAGCGGGDKTRPRDFNELIPRLMSAANSSQSTTQAATNLFNATSPDERRDAIAYLEARKYGHQPPYMRAYTLLATDPHPQVRAQAMRALGSSGQASAVPTLLRGLADDQPEVRRDAATALATTWSAAAEAPLRDHLHNDVDDQVKINCARALRNFHTPETLRALIDALDDHNAAVAYSAHESLQGLTGQRMPIDTRAWLTWYQQRYAPATAPAR